MVTGTTAMFSSGMTRKQKREIKNLISKIWNDDVSESFVQEWDDDYYITIDNWVTNIGNGYDDAISYLRNVQKKQRTDKINRII